MSGFPFRLYEMLQAADESVVSWQPNGSSFMIRDNKKFVEDVLPRHFGHGKLSLFQKQLIDYTFVQAPSGRDRGAYRHPLFLRGQAELLLLMKARERNAAAPQRGLYEATTIDLLQARMARIRLEEKIAKTEGSSGAPTGASIPGWTDKNKLHHGEGLSIQALLNEDAAAKLHQRYIQTPTRIGGPFMAPPRPQDAPALVPGNPKVPPFARPRAMTSTSMPDHIKTRQAAASMPLKKSGPLRVPGSLVRPGTAPTPTALRLVLQQEESRRWQAPVEKNPVAVKLADRDEQLRRMAL